MMNTLEREIIEKFHQLDKNAQKRIRELIEKETDASGFDYDSWFHNIEALRQEIRAGHGDNLPAMDGVGILRDIRDGVDE